MSRNAKSRRRKPALRPLGVAVLGTLAGLTPALASQEGPQAAPIEVSKVEFASDFLATGSSQSVDLSRFEQSNAVPPGVYEVDVLVNQNWIGRMSVHFEARDKLADAQPVFDRALLEQIGVALKRLPPDVGSALDAGQTLRIEDAVRDASASFDFAEQRLTLSVPQIALDRHARGYVSPELWDSGVTAAILGYDANVYHYGGSDGMPGRTQTFVGVNAGFNVGGWRFRHQGSFQGDTQGGNHYQNVATFAQRDLTDWKSQLTIGDAFTSGELFDSTGFRGVRIESDDRMLPDSLRGYAPTIRGVASTNARVTVRQNGNVIYETVVAPGAFVIDDLYPTGYGGDLDVTVLEADGRTQTFSVPYAAVPLSLRPGVSRFSAVVGQVRDTRLADTPLFAQATWQRGITNTITAYAGLTGAPGYGAGLFGSVLNTPIGAFGMDVTQALTNVPGSGRHTGTSVRASYSKLISETGTNFSLAAYRYSTGGYFSLNDAMLMREQPLANTVWRPRNRAQITMNQNLGQRGGQLYATGSTVNYWNRGGSDVNYSVGYSNNIGRVGFNLSATRQRSSTGHIDTLYYANVTIPLGSKHPLTLSTNVAHSQQGLTTIQTSLAGSAGVDNALSYGITASHAGGGMAGTATNGGANLAYRGSMGTLSSSVSAGQGYMQAGVGVRGAVVAHPGGVTLSQPVSDTITIVNAKDATGARVLNAAGVKVDGRGYAVVPYMTPYSMNTVELDPKGLSTDVELQTTSQQVAPRAGAVTMLRFATVSGRTAVIRARRANGEPLPFGATVYDDGGNELGVVGQASRIVARGLQEHGELTVKWGDGPAATCRIGYTLPARKKGDKADTYQQIDAVCAPPEVTASATGTTGAHEDATGAAATEQTESVQ